jgi:hypothetical protein
MLDHLAPLLNDFLQGSAVILGLSALLHAALILPMGLMHILLARITGVDVK